MANVNVSLTFMGSLAKINIALKIVIYLTKLLLSL
jgi:hypothetical protein